MDQTEDIISELKNKVDKLDDRNNTYEKLKIKY